MRVMQLISSLGFFGAENVLLELSKELKASSFDPIVCCFRNRNNPHVEVVEEAEKRGIPTVVFPCDHQFDITTIISLRKYLLQEGINILHTHNYKSNFYALFSSIGTDIARISTCHNWLGQDCKMRFYAGLDKFLLKHFDRVVAVSSKIEEELLINNIPDRKIGYIPNGIDIDGFKKGDISGAVRDNLGIPNDYKVVGTIGRLTGEKGHIFLIEAAKKIIETYPKIFFLIVGDGPLMESLKKEAENLPFIFTGFRSDIRDIYSATDIFVLPSLNEGLPMVILEAMASKKPVVATRVGNIPKVLKGCGLVIDSGDKDQLSDALLSLLNDDIECERMAEKGYKKVVSQYSSERMAKEYVALYKDIISEREN